MYTQSQEVIIMKKITPKEKELLLQILEYGILSTNQIMLINGVGKREVQRKLENLRKKDLITFHNIKKEGRKGRTEYVSSISEIGATIIRNEFDGQFYFSSDKIIFKNIYTAKHQLLLNWFRIHLNFLHIKLPDLTVDFISATTPFLPLKKNGLPLISEQFETKLLKINFTPDGVFCIKNKTQNKSLLFMLEVDMGTESLTTRSSKTNNIATKIKNYSVYFQTEKYKRYQKKWNTFFNGFRLLFLTNSLEREEMICKQVGSDRSNNFVWISTKLELFEKSLGGKIWVSGGNLHTPKESIIGPSLNYEESLFL